LSRCWFCRLGRINKSAARGAWKCCERSSPARRAASFSLCKSDFHTKLNLHGALSEQEAPLFSLSLFTRRRENYHQSCKSFDGGCRRHFPSGECVCERREQRECAARAHRRRQISCAGDVVSFDARSLCSEVIVPRKWINCNCTHLLNSIFRQQAGHSKRECVGGCLGEWWIEIQADGNQRDEAKVFSGRETLPLEKRKMPLSPAEQSLWG
jgi:hypothetical protein